MGSKETQKNRVLHQLELLPSQGGGSGPESRQPLTGLMGAGAEGERIPSRIGSFLHLIQQRNEATYKNTSKG